MRRNLIDFPPWRKKSQPSSGIRVPAARSRSRAASASTRPPYPPAAREAALPDHAPGACRSIAAASKGRSRDPRQSRAVCARLLSTRRTASASNSLPNRRCALPIKCSSFLQKSSPALRGKSRVGLIGFLGAILRDKGKRVRLKGWMDLSPEAEAFLAWLMLRLEALEAENADLRRRLGLDSSNSSMKLPRFDGRVWA